MGGVWGMNRVETINGRTAVNRHLYLVIEFVDDVKRFAENHEKTLEDSLNYLLAVKIKHSSNDTARCAWEIIAEKAKIDLDIK
jgi:hypothetical protein